MWKIYTYFDVKMILESSNNTQKSQNIKTMHKYLPTFPKLNMWDFHLLMMTWIFLNFAKVSKDFRILRTTCSSPDLWVGGDKLACMREINDLIHWHDMYNARELAGICTRFTHILYMYTVLKLDRKSLIRLFSFLSWHQHSLLSSTCLHIGEPYILWAFWRITHWTYIEGFEKSRVQ